ncbi:MAG TPA: tetratricopeptide repeat protein, partial [Bryobacteraceae bacterium]|nr:tetratricopeptide repeat protein [Bryobacteraceae bacterium]
MRAAPVLLSILVACSRSTPQHHGRAAGMPDLPHLNLEDFQPRIREQVRTAWLEVTARPGDADANGRTGMLLQVFEQYDAAEICYRRARSLAPDRFEWAYYLGLVEAINGRNAEAAEALREALRIDSGYMPARLKLAEVLLNLGRLDECGQVVSLMIQENSQFAPAYYWSGRLAAARDQAEVSIAQYQMACELWPGYGTAHYALALACQRAGHAEDARRHMTEYQKYKTDGDPQPEDPRLEAVRALDNTALAHLMKGVDFENAGDIAHAIAEHEEAVKQDGNLAQGHANLISLYARAGQPERAERAYRRVQEINPNLPQSHYDYGVFLVSRRRFREAETAFRKALQTSPNYAEAHSNLGAMLERDGKADQAASEYRTAIRQKPNYRQAHFQLGRMLLMKHSIPEAIAELSQTLTTEDSDTPRFR